MRAARELNRSSYGFEIDKTCYKRAKEEMLAENYAAVVKRREDMQSGQMNIFEMIGGKA